MIIIFFISKFKRNSGSKKVFKRGKIENFQTTLTHRYYLNINYLDLLFRRVEEENENLGEQFRENIGKRFENLEQDLSFYAQELVQFHLSMKDQIGKLSTNLLNVCLFFASNLSKNTKRKLYFSNNTYDNLNYFI